MRKYLVLVPSFLLAGLATGQAELPAEPKKPKMQWVGCEAERDIPTIFITIEGSRTPSRVDLFSFSYGGETSEFLKWTNRLNGLADYHETVSYPPTGLNPLVKATYALTTNAGPLTISFASDGTKPTKIEVSVPKNFGMDRHQPSKCVLYESGADLAAAQNRAALQFQTTRVSQKPIKDR